MSVSIFQTLFCVYNTEYRSLSGQLSVRQVNHFFDGDFARSFANSRRLSSACQNRCSRCPRFRPSGSVYVLCFLLRINVVSCFSHQRGFFESLFASDEPAPAPVPAPAPPLVHASTLPAFPLRRPTLVSHATAHATLRRPSTLPSSSSSSSVPAALSAAGRSGASAAASDSTTDSTASGLTFRQRAGVALNVKVRLTPQVHC